MKWKTNTTAEEWYLDVWTGSHLAIGPDGKIYLSYTDLYAFNPDGTKAWTYKGSGYPADFDFSPTIGPDGTIYSVAWNYLRAIRPNGKLKWSFDAIDELQNSPTIGPDGTIYVSSEGWGDPSENMSYLYAIDNTGHLKWKLGTYANSITQPVIDKDGTIYYSTSFNWAYTTGSDRILYAIASNGSMKWRFKAEGTVYENLPAIGPDGTIYIGSQDNYLYALNTDGTLKWKLQLYGSVGTPVISADGIIFVVTNSCYLTAIDSKAVRMVDGIMVTGVKWLFDIGNDCINWGCSVDFSHPVIGADGTVYLGTRGPSTDTQYYLLGNGRLIAIGTNGSNSTPSGTLPPPTNLRARVDNNTCTANLSWDPPATNGSSPIAHYEIQRYPEDWIVITGPNYTYGSYFGGANVDGNLTYFYDDWMGANYTYYYWIVAYPADGSNRSPPSDMFAVVSPWGSGPSGPNLSQGHDSPIPVLFIAPPLAPSMDPRENAITNMFIAGLAFLICTMVGILVLSSETFSYSVRPMAVLLFSRKKKEEVLDNFIRGQLYGYIVDSPGINLGELMKKVTRASGTVVYHLRTLERDGLIRSYRDGLRRLFFPGSMKIPEEFMELTELQRIIFKLIKERPGISQREIASRMEMSPAKVHRNVHGLESKGFIRIEKGRRTRLYLVDG